MNQPTITFGSLFSGIGGLDLGLQQAGFKASFQIENDKHCLTILRRHWPDVPKNEIRPCMGLVGGDPCPIRSTASNIRGTIRPDMSGYFLAMVARCKPRWILRENVPAPDVHHFGAGLAVLGYRKIIIEINSAAFTGQSRRREFVVAFDTKETLKKFSLVAHEESNQGFDAPSGNPRTALLCITTRGKGRNSIHDNWVYEGPEWGIRSLSHAERESLQGFPAGWTDGIPQSARERTVGNAVTVPVAKWLGERIALALSDKGKDANE